jgi:hypothetical protein
MPQQTYKSYNLSCIHAQVATGLPEHDKILRISTYSENSLMHWPTLTDHFLENFQVQPVGTVKDCIYVILEMRVHFSHLVELSM